MPKNSKTEHFRGSLLKRPTTYFTSEKRAESVPVDSLNETKKYPLKKTHSLPLFKPVSIGSPPPLMQTTTVSTFNELTESKHQPCFSL